MLIATYILFSLGVACEIAATALALLLPLRARGAGSMLAARVCTAAGGALLTAVLGLRWAYYGQVPLTSGVESLSLLVIILSFTVLALTFRGPRRNLVLIYLPAIAGISLIAAVLAPTEMPKAPKELSPWLLLLHVVPAFLAYAWFLIAMLTSGVYLFQASRLKRHAFTGLVQQLPSLEHLDRTLFALIRMAYPLFIFTLVTGCYWAWYDRELLGTFWWLSPKIILSLCMVVIYAVCYHGRAAGWLRGPRLANVLVIGIGGLLLSYLLLELFHLTNYNFWGGAA